MKEWERKDHQNKASLESKRTNMNFHSSIFSVCVTIIGYELSNTLSAVYLWLFWLQCTQPLSRLALYRVQAIMLMYGSGLDAGPSWEGYNLGQDVYGRWAASWRIWKLEAVNSCLCSLGDSDSVHGYLGGTSVSSREDKLYHLCLSSYSRDLLTVCVMPGSKLNSGRKMCKATITYCKSAENDEQSFIMADTVLEFTPAYLRVSLRS